MGELLRSVVKTLARSKLQERQDIDMLFLMKKVTNISPDIDDGSAKLVTKIFPQVPMAAGLHMLTASLAAVLSVCAAQAAEWNYFGGCFSDDVIIAQNGRFYRPCDGRGCSPEWKDAGSYTILANKVIEASWVDSEGARRSATYTHRSLLPLKCKS
jgi:hypothetical protein